MLRIELSKIASWLYQTDKENPAIQEIYKLQEGSFHSLTEIDTSKISEPTQKEIASVQKLMDQEEKKRQIELKKSKRKKR